MYNIENEAQLERARQEMPGFSASWDLASIEFLNAAPENRYTVGKNGIAKAHFMTSSGKVMVNPTQALVLLTKAYAIDRTEKALPDQDKLLRSYDQIKRLLWPINRDSNNISDSFYKQLLGTSIPRDTFRNVDNSALNKRIFDMTIITHFECVDGKIGDKYTEDQIREINEQLFKEEIDKVRNEGPLTNIRLAIIEDEVRDMLRYIYGWRFTHRSYELRSIDWEIINGIAAAFPTLHAAVKEAVDMKYPERKERPGEYMIGNTRSHVQYLLSEYLNPIAQTAVYKRLRKQHLRKVLDLIKFHDIDFNLIVQNEFLDEGTRYDQISDYIHKLSYQFVLQVEQLRYGFKNTEKAATVGVEIAQFILMKMSSLDMIHYNPCAA